jgi:MinD-like ATPase involved in chromosome partitioning or flagellar assembly
MPGPLGAPGGPRRRGYAIAVVAPKGGAGKSSVATNLGVYLGLRLKPYGRTVAILDANVQQADVGKYLNYYTPCITDLVRDPSGISPARINDYMVHPPQFGISAMLGPSAVKDADPAYINGALYTTVLNVLRELYDYVIIDTPVAEKYHDIFSEFVLPQADFLVVAANPNYTTLINIDRWLRDITMTRNAGGAGVDPQRIGILLNKAKDDIDCSEDDVRRELAAWNFLGALPYSSAWERANNNFEVVADKNYTELNQSFSSILFATTGEEGLLADIGQVTAPKAGLLQKLGRAMRRGS